MKKGIPYQGVVESVVKVLYPGADVVVGKWVKGPYGSREVDVQVRGKFDGKELFVLIAFASSAFSSTILG